MIFTKIWKSFLISTLLVLLINGSMTSCSFQYGFTTNSLDYNLLKTFSVYYFPNRARSGIINPNLSQQITEALQDKLLRQTKLDQLEEGGDLEFEGQIEDYSTRPMTIQEGDLAAQTRLTVSVKVKYTNNKNHDEDWEKTFSAYEDFSSIEILSDVEEALMVEILEKLTDDILNSSVANW